MALSPATMASARILRQHESKGGLGTPVFLHYQIEIPADKFNAMLQSNQFHVIEWPDQYKTVPYAITLASNMKFDLLSTVEAYQCLRPIQLADGTTAQDESYLVVSNRQPDTVTFNLSMDEDYLWVK